MMTDQHHIELDDLPIAEAVADYTWAIQPAEPDVGIDRPYVDCGLEIASWSIGALHLTRDQLCLAIGADAVQRLEEQQADIVADQIQKGEYE